VDPWGLSGCSPDKEPNVVYRAMTEQDVNRVSAGQSIQGKALGGSWSADEHVANQALSVDSKAAGGAAANSPWISTTKDINVARAYDSGNGIATIDLNKVSSQQVEVWQTAPRTTGVGGLAYQRSIWSQEVTVFQDIPNAAITGITK
jgi:hypothetical protein